MLWSIPRGRPTTREPYNQRAEGHSCKEGTRAWADLVNVEKARTKNQFYTTELSSALLPGAQAVNAEAVPFEGRAEQNLLLHFWPLTTLLFVPQQIDADGSAEFAGFTLAVPEVADLCEFVEAYPKLLSGLDEGLQPGQTARGYRPRRAVIDLPAEGALAFFDHLAAITGMAIESGSLRYSIHSVEYIHFVKLGNNVKTMAAGRISPNTNLLAGYRAIVAPTDESVAYRNPLFRRGLLSALLEGEQWFRPFTRTLVEFDAELFIRHHRKVEDDEKGPPHFANDAAKKLRHEATSIASSFKRYASMPETERVLLPKPTSCTFRILDLSRRRGL